MTWSIVFFAYATNPRDFVVYVAVAAGLCVAVALVIAACEFYPFFGFLLLVNALLYAPKMFFAPQPLHPSDPQQ